MRLVIALTVLMSGAILAQAALEGFSLLRVVQITAVLSGLVPYGLFFLIAARLHRRCAAGSRLRRAGATGQRRRVGEQRRRRVHRQDRHAHHRAAHARRRSSPSAARTPPRRRRCSARSPAASAPRTSPPRRWPRRCPARRGPSATRCRSPRRCAGPGSCRPTTRHVGAGRARRARARTSRGRSPTTPSPHARRRGLRVLVARPSSPAVRAGCATPRAARQLPDLEPVAIVALADELRPEVADDHRPLPRGRRRGQGALRRRPAHRRRARHPRRARRGRAGARRRARRPRRRRRWTGSSPAPRCSAGSPPSTRSGSSRRCAGRATTSR